MGIPVPENCPFGPLTEIYWSKSNLSALLRRQISPKSAFLLHLIAASLPLPHYGIHSCVCWSLARNDRSLQLKNVRNFEREQCPFREYTQSDMRTMCLYVTSLSGGHGKVASNYLLWIASHRPCAFAIVIIVAGPFRQLWGACGW
jgi:hypothetical protein